MKNPEKSARAMVGDGKLPNLYWVSSSEQWLTNKGGDSNSFDWAGEVYDNIPRHYQIFGPFKSFAEAKDKAEELSQYCISPEETFDAPHSVSIEDRITGTLFEGCYFEAWHSRGNYPDFPSFEWEWRDDTSFTRKKLGESFV